MTLKYFLSFFSVSLTLVLSFFSNSAICANHQSAFINNTAELSYVYIQDAQFKVNDRFHFSFRTCTPGELFSFESLNSRDSMSLKLFANGTLNLIVNTADVTDQIYLAEDLSLNNNQWYSIDKEFQTGELYLKVERGPNVLQQVLISNSTLRRYLWNLEFSSLEIGQGFTGCVQQGIGLDFTDNAWTSTGSVLWDVCPLESSSFAGCRKFFSLSVFF